MVLPGKKQFFLLLVISLLGSAVCLAATSLYGPAISSETVGYLSAAQKIVSGEGLRIYDGRPYIYWTPVYPIILSIFMFFKCDPMSCARLLNALLFGGVVFFSWTPFSYLLRSKKLALLGSLFVMLSYPILSSSFWASTEILSVFLVEIFIVACIYYVEKGGLKSLIAVSICSSLAFLIDYTGFVLVATGIGLILSSKETGAKKVVRETAFFLSLSCIPASVWLIRNFFLYETVTYKKVYYEQSFLSLINKFIYVVSGWILPHVYNVIVNYSLFMLLTAFFVFGFVRLSRENLQEKSQKRYKILSVLSLFCFVYSASVLAVITVFSVETISDRQMAPLFLPFICILLVFVDDLFFACGSNFKKFGHVMFLTVILSLFFSYLAANSLFHVLHKIEFGAGGYNTEVIVNSPTMKGLKKENIRGSVFGNASPEAVYFVSGKISKLLPYKYSYQNGSLLEGYKEEVKSMGERVMRENGAIVWFENILQPYTVSMQEIEETLSLIPFRHYDDGTIYKVRDGGKKLRDSEN